MRNHRPRRRPSADPAFSASASISSASARPSTGSRCPRPTPMLALTAKTIASTSPARRGSSRGSSAAPPPRSQRLFQHLYPYALHVNLERRRSPREANGRFSQPPDVSQGAGQIRGLPVRLPAGLGLAAPELRVAKREEQVAAP